MGNTEATVVEDERSRGEQVAPLLHPYPPSVVNHIISSVRRSRLPAWVIYGTLAALLVGIEITVKWLDGTIPSGFQLIHLMLPVYAMIVLPSMHYRDDLATRLLAETRPLLKVDDETYRTLRYRLTNLPANRTFLAGAGGLLALAVLTWIRPADTDTKLGMMTSPAATLFEWSLQFFVWTGVGVTTYHIVHQLLLVNEIYTRYTRISLFTLGPLYAFSRLTAVSSLFTVAVVAVASLALSSLASTIQWVILGGSALLLAAATFVIPLWGTHQLLAQEKSQQQDALSQRIANVLAALQDRVDRSDLEHIDDLTGALDGLIVGGKELEKVSTWPWEPDTLRTVVTGLILPIVIWLITKILERMSLF